MPSLSLFQYILFPFNLVSCIFFIFNVSCSFCSVLDILCKRIWRLSKSYLLFPNGNPFFSQEANVENYNLACSGTWWGLWCSFNNFQFTACFKYFEMRRNFPLVELGICALTGFQNSLYALRLSWHLSELRYIPSFQPESKILGHWALFFFPLQSFSHMSEPWETSCCSSALPSKLWWVSVVCLVKTQRDLKEVPSAIMPWLESLQGVCSAQNEGSDCRRGISVSSAALTH